MLIFVVMTNFLPLLTLVLILSEISISTDAKAQEQWLQSPERGKEFIENKGQFDQYACEQSGPIRYALDEGTTKILFGEKGIVYYFLNSNKVPKSERAEQKKQINAHADLEQDSWAYISGKYLFESDRVWMTWNHASTPTIETAEKSTAYHSYTFRDNHEYKNISYVPAFKQLTYHELYPGIDMYINIHEDGGYKYTYQIKPGADLSLIESIYSRDITIKDGTVHIPTRFGDIIDHNPLAFYTASQEQIPIVFHSKNTRQIQFSIGDYQHNAEITIDPWVQTPNFNTSWKCIWECERDATGNVYVIGGIEPMQVLKYNAAGTLQWTYNTPYDTSSVWLGTFATDDAGNCYVTAGSTAQIQKINTSAVLQWNNTSPGGLLSSYEFWSISFNCDQSKLIVGGTGGSGLQLLASVFDIDVNSGNILSTQNYTQGQVFSIPPSIEEVRSICSSPNGKFYFLTQDTIGAFNQNLSLCSSGSSLIFKNSSTYNFGYKCENYRFDNSGICAIKANNQFLYTQNGTSVHKRNLADGSIILSAPIPGGGNSPALGENSANNSGIDIDDCGNIYVGSQNGVSKFDANLNLIASYPTSFNVYDVHVNSGGELIAAGSTGNSSSGNRTGYIQSINVSACGVLTVNCCDASICPAPNLCSTSASVQLTAATAGGTWSGPGVSSGGLFNPSLAGVGTHTIIYTLPCGADSIQMIISPCQDLTACLEPDGTVTVSNGIAPYSWSYFQPATSTPITNEAECTACGYTWFFGTCLNGFFPATSCDTPEQWVVFSTQTNASIPNGITEFQITDNAATTTLFNIGNLQPCTVCPTIAIDTLNLTNCSCTGDNDGAISIIAIGGTAPYAYSWSSGNSGSQISNLTAGDYTVTITDANSCTGSYTISITEPANTPLPDIQFNITDTLLCLTDSTVVSNSNIETGVTYSWSFGNNPPINNVNTITIQASDLGLGSHILSLSGTNSCGNASVTQVITVIDCTIPPPVANFTVSADSICIGDCVSFNNFSTYENGATFSWSFENGTPWLSSALDPGSVCFAIQGIAIVKLVVTNPDGQKDSLSLSLFIDDCQTPPLAKFSTAEDVICSGECVRISNESSASINATYEWTFDGATPSSHSGVTPPDICYELDGTYSILLIVSDTGGIDTAVTSITVNYCIDIPNAFSPNSDGLNDVFHVISSGAFSNVDLKIYNRWGQLIFESAGVNNGWDGTFKGIPANVGVYVYTVTVRLANGETFIKNGNVTLLR